jgi:hypothetical protein
MAAPLDVGRLPDVEGAGKGTRPAFSWIDAGLYNGGGQDYSGAPALIPRILSFG